MIPSSLVKEQWTMNYREIKYTFVGRFPREQDTHPPHTHSQYIYFPVYDLAWFPHISSQANPVIWNNVMLLWHMDIISIATLTWMSTIITLISMSRHAVS